MRLALMQTEPQSGIAEALALLEVEAARAKAAGVDILVTPEMFMTGYNIGADAVREAARQMDVAVLSDIASRHGLALVVGAPEMVGEVVYNAAFLIDATGGIRTVYHKTHLFGPVDRRQFSPGRTLSEIVEIGGWKLGLAICYDVEFPELVRALVLRGADLVLVPTANMRPFESVCTRLVPARAQENGVHVAYVNYLGREGAFDYCGLSCLCDPAGEDVVRAQGVQTLYADLPQTAIARGSDTHLHDRRPDLYEDIIGSASAISSQ